MKNAFSLLVLVPGIMLSSCASDDGSAAIEPPAPEDVFQDRDGDGQIGDPTIVDYEADGEPIYETYYFFDDQRLKALCLWPDADSFDDYYEIDQTTGEVIIARGTASIATEEECPADGIATGPLRDELFPSSWCRQPNCEPVND